MARDAIAFLAAMEFGQADVLGFSIGSFVAQDITLIRPSVLRRLIRLGRFSRADFVVTVSHEPA